ncbi:MAG: helix-turn-helix transcriptional regulator [Erysipelotrichaceae bacterium]|nr:helix-turn-helix transcriptional regulator [Erysipelotrichaceae bacterium]
MDQIKIGKFIAECRKEKDMTQALLAEKLNISDRAVSKWETGKSLPDVSIMMELCGILNITVNELLSGERITSMEEYQKKAEENMISLQTRKEKANKDGDRYFIIWLIIQVVLIMPVNMLINYYFPENTGIVHEVLVVLSAVIVYQAWFNRYYEVKLKENES